MRGSYDFRAVEARWRRAWDEAGCHRAPRLPAGPKFFNYDSGPFPNGPLHIGHVRTYLYGDVTARYQRLRGRCVLYATEWDAFGLPNEIEAARAGVSPGAWTERWIGTMSRQLRELGISYDWSRVRRTSDPRYYGTTQALFLDLFRRGIVERREGPAPWCPGCRTSLSAMQVEGGACWRCSTPVESRVAPQWFVLTSRYTDALLATLDRLEGWSEHVRRLVRARILARGAGSRAAADWPVSRQRAWGTPIPIVRCAVCGDVPVPAGDLPVVLPDDLDWSRGAAALEEHPRFALTPCPRCGASARRESATLDCFFDDAWCQLGCLTAGDSVPGLPDGAVQAWLPVDRFHSGLDTVGYLHIHRFLGLVLHESGRLADAEPIGGHVGHALVVAAGRKMGKHLGNAVSPRTVLRARGADALRLAVLRAAGPRKVLAWDSSCVERSTPWLGAIHGLYLATRRLGAKCPSGGAEAAGASQAVLALRRRADAVAPRIARFIEDYRFNAAVDALETLWRPVERFARARLESGRFRPEDAATFGRVLDTFAVLLAPFAPHLAEEVWSLRDHPPFVAQARWPAGGRGVSPRLRYDRGPMRRSRTALAVGRWP